MGILLTTQPQASAMDAVLSFAQALLVLTAFVMMGWLFFRARFQGSRSTKVDALRVESRTALDVKSSLWVIEVEGKRLLIGTSDGAAPRLLSELEHRAEPKEHL